MVRKIMKAFSNSRPSTAHVREEREISPGDVIYSMVTLVNNSILCVGEFLTKYILKVLIPKKKGITLCDDGC